MSVFLMLSASSTVLHLTHSVASHELAIAEPHPKVLNLASSMTLVSGLIFISASSRRRTPARRPDPCRHWDLPSAGFRHCADYCSDLRLYRCMPLPLLNS